MLLGGLQKMTLVDYPGRVAATVFTVGCNFSCPFCHNPELVKVGSDRAQFYLPEEELFDFLASRQGMIEGVCVTGGEPTLYSDLEDFLRKIKELGFLVKLDTNGGLPDVLENLLAKNLVDYAAMDIKGPLENYHKFINANVDFQDIHRSTQIIRSMPNYEFRTTVVPRLHHKKDFLSIAQWLEGAKRYFLQQFRPGKTLDEKYVNMKPYSEAKLSEIRQLVSPYFEYCDLRL